MPLTGTDFLGLSVKCIALMSKKANAILSFSFSVYTIFSSFHELIRSRGVRRPSVNILRKSLFQREWPDRDQTCTGWSPGEMHPGTRMCSRSRSKVT